MTTATVSSKYQVVIPKEIRTQARIRKGEKVTLFFKGGVITMVPHVPIESLRGFAKGINTKNIREKKDRF